MSNGSTTIPVQKRGEFFFPLPRQPRIRIWGSSEFYPNGLWIQAIDDPGGSFAFTEGMPKTPFRMDKDDSGNWTTADIGDVIFLRGGTPSKRVEGWIYVSLGKDLPPKYTVYVYDDGEKVGTKFGFYTEAKKEPTPFEDGGENYFWEMSDSQGLWLWLYRLYAKPSA